MASFLRACAVSLSVATSLRHFECAVNVCGGGCSLAAGKQVLDNDDDEAIDAIFCKSEFTHATTSIRCSAHTSTLSFACLREETCPCHMATFLLHTFNKV
jgi:hypothetical protein